MQSTDPLAAVFDILKTWGPFLFFIGVWLYAMRRYSSQSSQWGQAARHLEAIEKHLARIASLLEERRGK
jgi:hypothetical protein